MEKINKLQQELLKLLESDSELIVLQTIEQLRDKGGDFAVLPLMKKYFSSNNNEIRKKIGKLFSDTKSHNIGHIITENILNYKNSDYLKDFLNNLWVSTVNFNDLTAFVTLLFSKNINVVIEAASIIDENINNISEENKNTCLQIFDNETDNINDDFQKQLIELAKQNFI